MAGKIIADTLEHSTAGSVTTDYVVNGSAKVWASINQDSTQAIRGSLNASSVTDNGTGRSEIAFSSSMSDANYCVSGLSKDGSGYDDSANISADFSGAITTSAFEVFCQHVSSTPQSGNDSNYAMMQIQGDLA